MEINAPCIITARLLPGIKIGDSTISISTGPRGLDGRTIYTYHIDTPTWSYTGDDLRSGFQGGTWRQGLEPLLSFFCHYSDVFDAAARRVAL